MNIYLEKETSINMTCMQRDAKVVTAKLEKNCGLYLMYILTSYSACYVNSACIMLNHAFKTTVLLNQ